ncbi:MAG: alpha-mannosidase [Candidatus Hydrogenedentes bacterium]|nr:alpha-mannosidase [Candidatus Hydrogenedentota bacterium]
MPLIRSLLSLFAIWLALPVSPREANPDVHAFYYSWYGNPQTDGAWRQWDHAVAARNPDEKHTCKPPEDIGANFYPEIGLYSSNDPNAVAQHMQHLKQAGVGVVSATWWGIGDYTDAALQILFDEAARAGVRVNFHIEPFGGRDGNGFRKALVHLLDRWGNHPALYRNANHGNRPLVYLYDSYKTPASEWARVLTPQGDLTIRGTAYDVIAIGLWVKEDETAFLRQGGFDGFYTYFATDRFTYGSTWANWPALAEIARENNWIFIPSVGPGYEDRKIRPWNGVNSRAREKGAYYDRAFQAAIAANPALISITSFNEWHEGTQIEPARSHPPALPPEPDGKRQVFYLDNEGLPPDWYLDRTRHWIGVWEGPDETPPER